SRYTTIRAASPPARLVPVACQILLSAVSVMGKSALRMTWRLSQMNPAPVVPLFRPMLRKGRLLSTCSVKPERAQKRVGVGVTVAVTAGVALGVGVRASVGVRVGVLDNAALGVGVGELDGDAVGLCVGVRVTVGVALLVGVGVALRVGVGVSV